MGNKNDECSRLHGKWRVVRKFTAGSDARQNTTLFEDYVVDFATGGVLTETLAGESSTTVYRLDAGSGTVDIQPADHIHSSIIFGAGGTMFRIVSLNDREMYLRKPHDIETTGDFEAILLERLQR